MSQYAKSASPFIIGGFIIGAVIGLLIFLAQ